MLEYLINMGKFDTRIIKLVGSKHKQSQGGAGARKKSAATHEVTRKSLLNKLKLSPLKEEMGSKRMVPEENPQTTSQVHF